MKIIQLEAAHANIDMIESRQRERERERGERINWELLWWLQCLDRLTLYWTPDSVDTAVASHSATAVVTSELYLCCGDI